MAREVPQYLTTKELAALLRIKERKVYNLAASGDIPCSRATGKLLFPREAVETWLGEHGAGTDRGGKARPNVFLGSHDPLLEWALWASRSGLATFFDGSLDGLERFAHGEGIATGLHIYESNSGNWNQAAVSTRFQAEPVVLVEWAWRDRGLIVQPDNPHRLSNVGDLHGRRFVPRQPEAGTQALFHHLVAEAGLTTHAIELLEPARNETDAAVAVLDDKADAALGLAAVAQQYRLGFIPLIRERFDLLVWRRAWFDEPMQRLLAFCRSAAFSKKVDDLGGYDVSHLGVVHFNGV